MTTIEQAARVIVLREPPDEALRILIGMHPREAKPGAVATARHMYAALIAISSAGVPQDGGGR